MDRKIALSVLAIVMLVLAAALLLPGGRQADREPKLPWQITTDGEGRVTVFGLTLGHSTLRDAQTLLQDQGELTLFRAVDGHHAVEAFFQRAALSGLRADFVLSLALSQEEATAMFERGVRLSKLGSGTLKVELGDGDRQRLQQTPIAHLTYIPATDLDPELIRRQFGEPDEILHEQSGVAHWLYPARGLDIAVNPEGKEVLQYLQPRQFEQAMAPLRQPGA